MEHFHQDLGLGRMIAENAGGGLDGAGERGGHQQIERNVPQPLPSRRDLREAPLRQPGIDMAGIAPGEAMGCVEGGFAVADADDACLGHAGSDREGRQG